jgi:hypothetical protein
MELNVKRSAKAPAKRAGSNDGEHELEDHVGLFGNGGGVAGIRSETDAAQEDMLEAADEAGPVGRKPATFSPEHGHNCHHGEALHHGAQDIFSAHQAAIEDS